MYDMPRSAYSVALETYHGASTIILGIEMTWMGENVTNFKSIPHV
jgi:hypothetical protein